MSRFLLLAVLCWASFSFWPVHAAHAAHAARTDGCCVVSPQTFAVYPPDSAAVLVLPLQTNPWEPLLSELAPHNPELAGLMRAGQAQLTADPSLRQLAQELWQQRQNFATQLSLAWHQGAQGPEWLFALDLRAPNQAQIKTLLEARLEKRWQASAGTSSRLHCRYFGSQRYYHLQRAGQPDLYLAVTERQLLGSLSMSPQALQDMLYRSRVLPASSALTLAHQPAFQRIQKHLHSRALWAYLNPAQLWPVLQEQDLLAQFPWLQLLVQNLPPAWTQEPLGLALQVTPEQHPQHLSLSAFLPQAPAPVTRRSSGDLVTQLPAGALFLLSEQGRQALPSWLRQILSLRGGENLSAYLDGRLALGLFLNPDQTGPEGVLLLGLKAERAAAFDARSKTQLSLDLEPLQGLWTQLGIPPAPKAQALSPSPAPVLTVSTKTGPVAVYALPVHALPKALTQLTANRYLRSELAQLQANLAHLQSLVEAYAVQHQGHYPSHVAQIEGCQDLQNPHTGKRGLGAAVSDYADLQRQAHESGRIFYQPRRSGSAYVLYGYGADGQLYAVSNTPARTVVERGLPVPARTEQSESAYLNPVFARQGQVLILAQTPELMQRALRQASTPQARVQPPLKPWLEGRDPAQRQHYLFGDLAAFYREVLVQRSNDEELAEDLEFLDDSQGLYAFVQNFPDGQLWQAELELDLDHLVWPELFLPHFLLRFGQDPKPQF